MNKKHFFLVYALFSVMVVSATPMMNSEGSNIKIVDYKQNDKDVDFSRFTMTCDNADFENAYKLAIKTVSSNVHGGILTAGADYGGEWARDCAINAWNGVSMLNPLLAETSLWRVTNNKDSIGHQYWDRIIWVVAALNHYKVTGDVEFLKQAYVCSVNSIKILEKEAFDAKYGLFTGPSVFNDGIAGYPEPIYDPKINSGFVLDHKNSKTIKCLSTNCIYYGAYLSLVEMAQLLKVDKVQIHNFQTSAKTLKANILKHLYSAMDNKLYYLIDNKGNVAKYQEGLGISYAIMFGVLNRNQSAKLLKNVKVSKFGITSIYPDFARFSTEKPGRHNNIIWPRVNGFFAQASIMTGDTTSFEKELNGLTHLALDKDKGDNQFWEIYNPYTGTVDGGWQGNHWKSCHQQTWSATAYLNMVYFGLVGMRIENTGISFSPYLPANISEMELKAIPYRQSVLDISIKGTGRQIKSFRLNGKQSEPKIHSNLKGLNKIEIELQ